MFIAHLPSGYIAAKWLSKHIKSPLISYRYFLISALFGAIAPDFDLCGRRQSTTGLPVGE